MASDYDKMQIFQQRFCPPCGQMFWAKLSAYTSDFTQSNQMMLNRMILNGNINSEARNIELYGYQTYI